MVIILSLIRVPSVPGPEYFDAGWIKVTKESKDVPSFSHFVPFGNNMVYPEVLDLP